MRAPGLAALLVTMVTRLPVPLRRRVLRAAFERARDAFNRGDFDRYDENTIENLSLDEAARRSFVRRARLRHRTSATGASLDYVVVQTTHGNTFQA